MSLILLLIILVITGVVLVKVPLESTMRWLIIAVVVVVTVVWLLVASGVIDSGTITTPTVRVR